MVRNPLSALVVSSAAILLATSVTPSWRAAAPPTVVVKGVGELTSAGAMPPAATWPKDSDASGPMAGAGTSGHSPRRIGAGLRERSTARGPSTGRAGDADPGPVRGAARPAASTPAGGPRWRWPVRPRPAVVRPFRAPLTTYGAGHRGLDLAVADGTPVLAVEGGVVTHAGLVAGRGTITVRHRGGLSSTYEPVDPMVAVGSVVVTGQVIGALRVRAGPAHCGAHACLHLGARRGATYLDPHPLLAGGRVALLPLGR